MIFEEGLKGMRTFLFGSKLRIAFTVWTIIALGIWLFAGDLATFFSAIGVIISGSSTIFFWNYRPITSSNLKEKKISGMKFLLIGGLCALWVEVEFWILEKIFGVPIAASPDLILDLIGTMPWYLIMLFLLWKVESKYSYSLYTILIFGGIYDFFADGILGTILTVGGLPLETLIILIITFPVFVIAYSFILLPSSYLFKKSKNEKKFQRENWIKYFYGFLPLVGLLIYGIIAFLLFRS